jgi:hypothetical protein
MAAYKRNSQDPDAVIRSADGAHIPADPRNRDYQEFVAWVKAGNSPDPADPVVADPDALPSIDYGAAIPAGFTGQVQAGVAALNDYLALGAPTAAQSAAALKVTIRLLLFTIRRTVR